MSRELSRRRLLAATGLLATGTALDATVGAARDATDAEPSTPADERPLRWADVYGDAAFNSAAALRERDDHILVLGQRGERSVGGPGWLFGIDRTSGEGLWDAAIENPDLDTQPQFQQLVPAAGDGDGFALLGGGILGDATTVVRTDAAGEVQWWETYDPEAPEESDGDGGGDGDEETFLLPQALLSLDDGYLVGGYRATGRAADAVTIKIDDEGSEQYRHRFFADEVSIVTGLAEADDGGFVGLAWIQDEPAESGSDGQPVRSRLFGFDESGDVQWQGDLVAPAESGTPQQSQALDFAATGDGYVVVGAAADEATGETDGWVHVTDGSGGPVESRRVSPRTVTRFNAVTADEEAITVAGLLADSAPAETSDALVAAFTSEIELAWRETAAPADGNRFTDVIATGDGGVAAAGTAEVVDTDGDEPQSRALLAKFGGDEAPTGTATESGTPTAPPTGTPTPTGTATSTPTQTATPTPTATAAGATTPTETTASADGAGFGIGAAVAGVAWGLWRRRCRSSGDVSGD